MPELTGVDFPRVLPLLPDGCGMARAVLKGRSPRGRVWVDDPARPARALVGTVELWYLLGAPPDDEVGEEFEQELRQVFEHVVLPGGAVIEKERDHEVSLTWDSPEWESRLTGLFGGRDLLRDPRRYLELVPSDLQAAQVPDGYEVFEVDEAFLDAAGDVTESTESTGSIRHWIESHHRVRADFLARCGATLLMHDGAPASWSVTDCHDADGVAEVGIETAPEHRRRGLAAAVTALGCARLFERGVKRIGWQCYSRNEGSLRTAARVGFKAVRDYPSRFRMFDADRHELVRGWCLLNIEQDAVAALEHLRPLLAAVSGVDKPEIDATWFVLAARAAARMDERDEGFALLAAARERDAYALAKLADEEDFAHLCADPRWQALVEGA